MRVQYDAEVDALTIHFEAAKIVGSEEVRPGVILDLDSQGDLVGLEILHASRHLDDPRMVSLTVRE